MAQPKLEEFASLCRGNNKAGGPQLPLFLRDGGCKGFTGNYLITSKGLPHAVTYGALHGTTCSASIDTLSGSARNMRSPVPGLLYEGY